MTLCDHTKFLYDSLGREDDERKRWPEVDRKLLREAGRRLNKHREGPLRTLRNERTAHLDLDVLLPAAAAMSLPEVLLPALGDALAVLLLCFNYRRVYTWARPVPGGVQGDVEIMTEYPLALHVKVDASQTVVAFGGQGLLVANPLSELQHDVLALYEIYNRLAGGAGPPHRTMFVRQHESDEESEWT